MLRRITITLAMFFYGFLTYGQEIKPGMSQEQIKTIQAMIFNRLGKKPPMFDSWQSESERKIVLERVAVNADKKRINLYFNNILAQVSIRESLLEQWKTMVLDTLGTGYEGCEVAFFAKDIPAARFIPNLYRKEVARDAKREYNPVVGTPIIKRLDQPVFGKGLSYRHIAMWPSHGYYYDQKDGQWQWQRPSLFHVIEDLNSFDYVNTYIAPMLENAGAVLLMPRERDTQQAEIIVDNDISSPGSSAEYEKSRWRTMVGGFKWLDTLDSENPFEKGSYLVTNTTASDPATLIYRPAIEKPGEYAVYVSWQPLQTNITNALYEVNYSGGTASFEVNQRIGGGWVYLGKFPLDAASIVTLKGAGQGTVTADAIKIGGGAGNVKRNGSVSGMPRWAEAARYWMQYSGVPSSIYAQDTEDKVKNPKGTMKDYQDDYKSRGDWCNWIKTDCKIPIDLALAIHTDAGVNDSIVGSLTINFSGGFKADYSNGTSKLAGRDMADIILTQVVADMRELYTPKWVRRSMYDKGYAEVSRPDVPAVIVEMFSHQNFKDMHLSLDPQFKFDMSRAIYKGVVRFLADRYSFSYAIQPLPPSGFHTEFYNGKLRLRWQPTDDPLEPTAKPTHYKLYTRTDKGFDQGELVYGTSVELEILYDGQVRSYKVTALNDGGESFPSEILAAGFRGQDSPLALIVNGFTKLSAPDTLKTMGIRGFDMVSDPGVAYCTDLGISGTQTDFNCYSPFVDNNSPGWGASTKEMASKGLPGNTFDYPVIHARAFMNAGYSVVSMSREAFETRDIAMGQLKLIDIIMGQQKEQRSKFLIYTAPLLAQIDKALNSGVNLFISGAYIGQDMASGRTNTDKVKQLTGIENGGLITNEGNSFSLQCAGKSLDGIAVKLPTACSDGCCYLPYINILGSSAQGASKIDSRAGTLGVIHEPKNRGVSVSLGFPLEALPQDNMNELVQKLVQLLK